MKKVALVHDYLNDFGGAERVLVALSELYPKAPIYTIFSVPGSPAQKAFKDRKVVTSWFQYLPFYSKLISPLRFLLPAIWKSFDFQKYDLVITSAAWAVTKGMNGARKEICYLHTPPRFLYGYDTSRIWRGKWYGKLVDFYALIVNHFLRQYDFKQAQKVNYFIANSVNTGKRLEKFYRRADYKVIYPPVDVKKIITSGRRPEVGDYYLAGGRLVAAKNFDLVIQACKKAGVNLKIFGDGPARSQLERTVPSSGRAKFLGRVSGERLISLYRGAKAFILAAKDEDFGITPIEASAAGCPVIAFRGGGYLETVREGETGVFFDELTPTSIVSAIKRSQKVKWNKAKMLLWAKKFSVKRFKKEMLEFVLQSTQSASIDA